MILETPARPRSREAARLEGLPPRLQTTFLLLLAELAARFSASGDAAELLGLPEDPPVFELAPWLAEDLGLGPEDSELLGRSASDLFLAAELRFRLLESGSPFGPEAAPLASLLERRVERAVAQRLPSSSPFWARWEGRWHRFGEAVAFLAEPPAEPRKADALALGDRWAPLFGMLAAGVALAGGSETELAQADELADVWLEAVQIRVSLGNLRRAAAAPSLHAGSFALWTIYDSIGRPWPGIPAAEPGEQPLGEPALLAALALSSARQELGSALLERLRRAGALAQNLGLRRVGAALSAFEGSAMGPDGRVALSREGPKERPFLLAPEPLLETAIGMARGAVLANLGERCWEIHRYPIFDEAPLVARFGEGAVLELLAARGEAPAGAVRAYLVHQARRPPGYFEHRCFPYEDSDSVGQHLRLACALAAPDGALEPEIAAWLDTKLERLEKNQQADGRIAIWLLADLVDHDAFDIPAILIGERCATAEALALVGLLRFARLPGAERSRRCRELAGRALPQLLARWQRHGYGAAINYPPAYSTWAMAELLHELERERPLVPAEELAATRHRVEQDFDRLGRTAGATTLDAAWMSLAAPLLGKPRQRRWLDVLLKRQGHDGLWPAEPFFFTAQRGGTIDWYRNAIVTSAFAWLGLCHWRELDKSEARRLRTLGL